MQYHIPFVLILISRQFHNFLYIQTKQIQFLHWQLLNIYHPT